MPDFNRNKQLRILIQHFVEGVPASTVASNHDIPTNISMLVMNRFLENKRNLNILKRMMEKPTQPHWIYKETKENDFFNVPGSGFDKIVEIVEIVRKTDANEWPK